MRVFLGLTEVSGYFSRLRQGLEDLGVECVHVSLQPHKFGYSGGQRSSFFPAFACTSVRWRLHGSNRGPLIGASLLALTAFSRVLLFIWAVVRFDVFVLGAGSSFFRFREFPLLRLLGKRIVYTLHGTEARPPYIDGFFEPEHYGITQDAAEPAQENATETQANPASQRVWVHIRIAARRRREVRAIECNAHVVICAPGYSHFLTRPFVSFYSVGIPLSIPQSREAEIQRSGEKVRILHAPSYVRGKGTDRIRAVISALEVQGMPIEYREISGRPNSEVLAAIRDSDFVVDQLYSDTPMAGFAAEAASLGKPAVVGGYYSRVMRTHLPEDQIPPTGYCHPDELQETVGMLVKDQEKRLRLGDAARTYVLNSWSSQTVAGRFLRLLEGPPPSEWLIDPMRVMYVQGCGLSESQARENVAAVIRAGGVEALQLSHKPALEELFMKFAQSEMRDVQTPSP